MNTQEQLQVGVAQSIYETVKTTVSVDGFATLSFGQLKRTLDTICNRQGIYPPPMKPNELYESLQSKPILFTTEGKQYAAIILDSDTSSLSPGRVKRLEREKGVVIYKRNSRVKQSRRPNNNWRTNENAKEFERDTTAVTIMPFEKWQSISNERIRSQLSLQEQERDKRLSERFIAKSKRQSINIVVAELEPASDEQKQNKKPWEPLIQNIEGIEKINSNAIVSIGMGVDKYTPLRILGYPLLALNLLREKSEMSLELYCATQFASLFGLSDTDAWNAETITRSTMRSFVRSFYPDVSKRVTFLYSKSLTNNQLLFIRDILIPILQTNRDIVNFANERDGIDSLKYIAAHSLYMRDPLPIRKDLYINPLPLDNRQIVMIGGDGERIMWEARKYISQTLGGNEPIQLYTTLGRTPPYFRKDDEPIIGDIVSTDFLYACRPEIYRDYGFLLVAIAQAYGDTEIQFSDVSAGQFQRKSFLFQDGIIIALDALNQFSSSQTL